MNWKTLGPQRRLSRIATIVFVVGLSVAGVIYLFTANSTDPDDMSMYDSKVYQHNMEVTGGKANLEADQFLRWLGGLWHGRALATTIGAISIFVSLGLSFIANFLWEDDNGPNDQGG